MLSAANAGTAQVRQGSPAVHATSYGDHLLSPPPAPGGASPPRSLSRSRVDARMFTARALCRTRESESAVGRWNLVVLRLPPSLFAYFSALQMSSKTVPK